MAASVASASAWTGNAMDEPAATVAEASPATVTSTEPPRPAATASVVGTSSKAASADVLAASASPASAHSAPWPAQAPSQAPNA